MATVLLAAVGIAPAFAQQGRRVVSDWSNHHVKFSNPGSEMDALMNGHRQQWQSFVNNPRYVAQQFKRSGFRAQAFEAVQSTMKNREGLWHKGSSHSPDGGLWTATLASAGSGTPQGAFPAEYDADFDNPSCTNDFIVFPVNANGSSRQANLVVFNHLYVTGAGNGFCTGTAPTTQAAYAIYSGSGFGSTSGQATTSPVLSEDGSQVAFVANVTSGFTTGAYFYVLTLGSGGTDTAPTQLTTTSSTTGTIYTAIALSHGNSDTISSAYVDYANNVAYVGDTGGYLHKIQNVFGSTAASEITTSPWPYRPAGGSTTLTGPVVDPATGNIVVGASNGNVYCVTAAGAPCGTGSEGSIAVATAISNPTGSTSNTDGAVIDAPIVIDNGNTSGTTGWIFAQAVYSTKSNHNGSGGSHGTANSIDYAVLAQAPLSSAGFGAAIGVDMGSVSVSSTGTTGSAAPTITLNASSLYSGDFDNEYYNSSGSSYSGYMYFCGYDSATSSGNSGSIAYDTKPELYRVGFTSNGTLTGTPSALFTLATNTTTHTSGCTPLTEFYNANANAGAGEDFLFLGVSGYGSGSNCSGNGCIMGFELPSDGSAPTGTTASYSLGGNGSGSSGIVIDNQSTAAGASQVYFSNLQSGNATAASQSNLN